MASVDPSDILVSPVLSLLAPVSSLRGRSCPGHRLPASLGYLSTPRAQLSPRPRAASLVTQAQPKPPTWLSSMLIIWHPHLGTAAPRILEWSLGSALETGSWEDFTSSWCYRREIRPRSGWDFFTRPVFRKGQEHVFQPSLSPSEPPFCLMSLQNIV